MPNGMIRHIVLLRFRTDVSKAERAGLMTALDSLRMRISGILGFTVLDNISPETAVVHGFLDGFAIDFVDAAARDAYLADASHREIGGRLVAACLDGIDGLIVFDHAI